MGGFEYLFARVTVCLPKNPLEEELQGEGLVADGEDRIPMMGEIPTVHASDPLQWARESNDMVLR